MIKIILFVGDTEIGDINKYAKNRQLSESLKSESSSATADQFTFDINWKQFQGFIRKKYDDNPESFLRVGKTRIVFMIDDRIRFSGWLSSRPGRSGFGAEQTLSLKFFEYFARLSGDLVCSINDKNNPILNFNNRPAHLYVQDLINLFLAHSANAGESLNWSYGTVNSLANKTMNYNDFQTIAKALCDAMNNTTGAGKFDVVFRTDPNDFTHQIIDILKPRGINKNIIIQYPSDSVYKLWSTDYTIDETNDYASEVLVAGNGQVGDPDAGEDTAELANAINNEFAQEYGYYRVYETQSSLKTQDAVSAYANKSLIQKDFTNETPKLLLVGRPISWGDYENEDNGLALGDSFYFRENTDDGADRSGYFRIIALETEYDDETGVESVTPTLIRIES